MRLIRYLIIAWLFGASVAASAQLSIPPAPVDLTPYARSSDVAAVQASMCQPSAVTPPPEIVGGAAGSGNTCRLANSVQPRITRTVAFTTDATGTAVVTWVAMPAVPLVFPIPNIASGATQGPLCYPVTGTITITGATIKCYSTQSVTVSLLGAVVAPLVTAGAGISGQALAIPAS